MALILGVHFPSWLVELPTVINLVSCHTPLRCNVCGKEFFEKALSRRHVKKATHGKKGRVKQNLERECEHCGRKFTQLREYRRHINNHQGESTRMRPDEFCCRPVLMCGNFLCPTPPLFDLI